jgi:hypothetical protein
MTAFYGMKLGVATKIFSVLSTKYMRSETLTLPTKPN